MDEKMLNKKIEAMRRDAALKIRDVQVRSYRHGYYNLSMRIKNLERLCHVNSLDALKGYIIRLTKGRNIHQSQTNHQPTQLNKVLNDKYHVQSMAQIKGIISKPNLVPLLSLKPFVNILFFRFNHKKILSTDLASLPKGLNGSNIGSTLQALMIFAKKNGSIDDLASPTFDTVKHLANNYQSAILSAMHKYFTTNDSVSKITKVSHVTEGFVRDCHSIGAVKKYNDVYKTNMLPRIKSTNVHNIRALMEAINAWYTQKNVTFAQVARPYDFAPSTLSNAVHKLPVIQMYNLVYHQDMGSKASSAKNKQESLALSDK